MRIPSALDLATAVGFQRWSGPWRHDRRAGRFTRRFAHRHVDHRPLWGLGLYHAVVVVEPSSDRSWVVSKTPAVI